MLEKIIITSLCITLIHASMMEGMIFFKIRQWMDKLLPAWIKKPLYECLICMCSFWGTIIFFMWTGTHDIYNLMVFIFSVGGANTLISVFINNNIIEKEPLPATVAEDAEEYLKYNEYSVEGKLISQLYEHCKRN